VGDSLARSLATQAHTPPDTAALAGLADQLDEILATESPEQAKELLRLLIKEIRVHNRRRIVPTYRVPAAVRAIPRKVGGTGLEPVTPQLVDSGRPFGACSLRLGWAAWLSGIRSVTKRLSEVNRTPTVAIVATTLGTEPSRLSRARLRAPGRSG
jgi:hypothetical protein